VKSPLCIYHGNCADGFGAAWAVWKAFDGKVDLVPGVYQNDPPDVAGRDVILVDFSYKRDAMKGVAMRAASVLVLDHHKSAIEDLVPICVPGKARGSHGLLEPKDWDHHLTNVAQDSCEGIPWAVYAIFDTRRSGATIAWDFFNPGRERPKLLDHIEDRDLWTFRLPGTREIQAALFSFPYDMQRWDDLIMRGDLAKLRAEGEAIERKHHKDVAELVAVTQRPMRIGGHVVPVANLPYTLTSDAGHLMAQGQPFAACYWDTPAGRVFSLRSTDAGLDVSEIAKLYGGGGHRNASGFRVAFDQLAQFEVLA
jgi:oligoribonuclease NrnB/cAMP/cGMP phosphodiesterase (DHH superfamily)